MNHASKKATLFTLLAFSLATCAPTMYAVNEPAQAQDVPTALPKLTAGQTDTINIALITLGSVLLAAAVVTATIMINKHLHHN